MTGSFLLRSRRIVTPAAPSREGTIVVEQGRIASIGAYDEPAAGRLVIDAGDAVVLPGLVDTHVHINEPGRTDWEGFASATRAAAAGGVTTLLDMPLNCIPATTSVAALERKQQAAAGQCTVDVGFIGGVVPGNTDHLRPLWEAGVFAFKCFMVPSGVEEFGHVSEDDLRAAVPVLAELGATLMVHAESPGPIDAAPSMTDPRSYAQYVATRPTAAEHEAIVSVLRLSHATDARVHIVHLASSDAIPLIIAARATDTPVTVETCPHYLHFAAEEVPDGATDQKCAPPIREARHRDALWRALIGGTISMVVSDHSPCPPALKRHESGSFAEAWGGIASLQHGLSVVWRGARARGVPVERLATWMCENPARLAGLWGRKGAIAPGFDADLVIWQPDSEHAVVARDLLQRHPISPYLGATLPGVVEATYLRGSLVYGDGRILGEPRGELLRRR